MAVISDLPEEVLVQIFSYYVGTEKQYKLVNIIRKVCRTWENASKSTQLWKTFDGTVPFDCFLEMCKLRELQYTEKLIFSNLTKKLTGSDVDTIYSNLPCVRRMEFSQVPEVEDVFFTCLKDQCPNLHELVFRNKLASWGDKIITSYCISPKLGCYLMLCGYKMTYLDFSYSTIDDANELFSIVTETCSNLEEFIAVGISGINCAERFSIGKIQKGCSKLKVLCLSIPLKYDENEWDPHIGLSELEVLAYHNVLCSLTGEILYKLLHLSTKLKHLDISESKKVKPKDLLLLPATDLQCLNICHTDIFLDLVFHYLDNFLDKWKHSLVSLDFGPFDFRQNGRLEVELSMENWETVEYLHQISTGHGRKLLRDMFNFDYHPDYYMESLRTIGYHYRINYHVCKFHK